MTSLFSFLRGRPEAAEDELAAATAVSTPTAVAAPTAMRSLLSIPHGAPAQDDVLIVMRAALAAYLPLASGSLPAPNVSIIKVEEKPTGLGNYIGDEVLEQFSIVLKGGRLQASVRFQLWADTPNNVDQAIDDLHGRLLAAKDDLWIAGFLRFVAEGSTLAEHIPSLPAWRRTADYQVLYEFRYTDTDDAQSLIARIPVHTDPEELDSPQRETTVVTDDMARWDEQTAPTLDLHGRLTVSRFSALAFVPGTPPSAPVMLLRTFDSAVGPPTAFADLATFVTAVTNPTTPARHAQVTFATFSDFITAFSLAGSPITLGDWDEDATPDSYQPLTLPLPTPITLSGWADHLQLVYQPGGTTPQFDQTAVLYIRAG
ncbi:MAG: hypothetical protein KC415_18375 [Anaerolineales bacterium]|nr:hypothetical protein [Anaerolineales bacterium]